MPFIFTTSRIAYASRIFSLTPLAAPVEEERENGFTSRSYRLPPPHRLLSKDLTGIARNVRGKANAAGQDAIQDALPAALIPPANQYSVPRSAMQALLAIQERNSQSNVDALEFPSSLSRNSPPLVPASCIRRTCMQLRLFIHRCWSHEDFCSQPYINAR